MDRCEEQQYLIHNLQARDFGKLSKHNFVFAAKFFVVVYVKYKRKNTQAQPVVNGTTQTGSKYLINKMEHFSIAVSHGIHYKKFVAAIKFCSS